MIIEDSPVKTYISLLRGINVGGHRKIKMDDLKVLFENLGLEKVRTYIQSGNVVFQSKIQNSKRLADLISAEIKLHFQIDVPVIIKNIEEFAEVYDDNPFIAQNKDTQKLYVIFLSDIPSESVLEKIKKNSGADLYITYKSAIYLFCPNGYGKTKLTNTFFENNLKIAATTRGWATVSQLNSIAKTLLEENLI